MEYILNKTPIRTTNNFKINDFKIDLDIIKTKFKDFKTKNISINTRIENNFESRIGLLEEKYLFVDVFNDKEIGYLEYDFDNDYLTSLINVNANDLIIIFKGDNAFLNTNIVINKAKTVSIINLTIILAKIAQEGGDIRKGLEKYREDIVTKVTSNISKHDS